MFTNTSENDVLPSTLTAENNLMYTQEVESGKSSNGFLKVLETNFYQDT